MLRTPRACNRERRHLGNSFVRWCAGAVLTAVLSGLTPAAGAQTTAVEFDIPAQAVSSALRAFAHQADVQLLVSTEGLDAIQANAVVGSFRPQTALEMLLAGTGLRAQYRPDATVAVGRESDAPVQPVGSTNSDSASQLVTQAAAQTDERIMDTGTSRTGQNNTQEGTEEAPKEIEEIMVTGSRIRGAQNASPVVTISRQEIDRAGFATVEEIVDKLPQNFGAGASLDSNTDITNNSFIVGGDLDNPAGGTSVNLRGLGASSTLVLLNGRRLSPSGREARFTDISGIPVSAIERVEVLTDGASAIYGSDAIGGVINFILRDDYDGAETRLRYGADARGDTSSIQIGQSFGKSWEDGSVLFTYEYYDSDNLASADRDFTSNSDLRRFGGTDRRRPGGNPANIVAGGSNFAIPAGQDGTALSPSDFTSVENGGPPLNLYNERAVTDVLPQLERHSAFLHFTQAIGAVELFTEAYSSGQETSTQRTHANISFDVPGGPNGNPFFVDPTGTGLTTVRVENYSFEKDVLVRDFAEIDTLGTAFGARFDLSNEWSAELIGNWAKEESKTKTKPILDQAALAAALAQTDPSLAFNPFGDGPANPAVIETFIDSDSSGRKLTNKAVNELRSIGFNVDGSVIDLPGGAVKVAAGIELREEFLSNTTVEFVAPVDVGSDLNRDVLAVYSELFLPLVSSSNDRTGLQRLELSLAARYEDYSDFGDSISPKVGIVWSPTQSLTLRGTYGTSFRAPALTDLDVSNLDLNSFIYFPQFVTDIQGLPFDGMIVLLGANEDLQPEEAVTWTTGIQWHPERVEGLSLDLTYFNVDFEDRITKPITRTTQAADPRFRTLLLLDPSDEVIAALINDPRNESGILGIPDADILSGVAPVGAVFDARTNNVSRSVVTGIELQLAYQFETRLGSFDIGLNGNYLFDFERAFIEADPLVEEVDTFGRPIDFKARGNVTWSRHAWAVTGFVNYSDGYTDNINNPASSRPVDSWTTVDLSIVYDIGNNNGIFSDTRLVLTTQNLFDVDPPFVDTLGGVAYDSANGSPLGRMLALQVTKEW